MPSPHPIRDQVLKQLKTSFPYQLDLVVNGVVYPYADVKAGLKVIMENSPEFYKVLHMYMHLCASRSSIAYSLTMDPSTAKRRLDRCADALMQYLNNRDIGPDDLYTITKIVDGVKENGEHYSTNIPSHKAPFPCLFPLADRSSY